MGDHGQRRARDSKAGLQKKVHIKNSHEVLRITLEGSKMSASGGEDSFRNLGREAAGAGSNKENLFQRSDSMAQITNRLVEMLDHIEQRVELLREHACAMEQERDCLLSMIRTIQANKELTNVSEGEREEIQVTAERLLGRCLTVEVQVSTPRNAIQEKALHQVNHFIDDLVIRVRSDLEGSMRSCQAYLNACLAESLGPVDQKFQAAIIECTADDQKKTRKRLESLLRTIEHAGGTAHS